MRDEGREGEGDDTTDDDKLVGVQGSHTNLLRFGVTVSAVR